MYIEVHDPVSLCGVSVRYFAHMEGGPMENVLTRYFRLRFENNAIAMKCIRCKCSV